MTQGDQCHTTDVKVRHLVYALVFGDFPSMLIHLPEAEEGIELMRSKQDRAARCPPGSGLAQPRLLDHTLGISRYLI